MKKLIIMAITVVLWFDLMGIAAVKGAERAHHRECVCEGDRCDEDCKGCDKCEKCIHRNDCECGEVCIDDCEGCDRCRDCVKRKRLDRRHRAAELEAQRRRDRLHMRRSQPRVVIGFNFPVYRYYYNGWGMRRSWRRPIGIYINMGPRIGRMHHHHHHHRRGR